MKPGQGVRPSNMLTNELTGAHTTLQWQSDCSCFNLSSELITLPELQFSTLTLPWMTGFLSDGPVHATLGVVAFWTEPQMHSLQMHWALSCMLCAGAPHVRTDEETEKMIEYYWGREDPSDAAAGIRSWAIQCASKGSLARSEEVRERLVCFSSVIDILHQATLQSTSQPALLS